MRRRDVLACALLPLLPARIAAAASVSTVIGNGLPGHGDGRVNNPYGVVIGPDGALYFCDLDNQRIRRLDLATTRTTDVAGSGRRGYDGDGGPATAGALNMPHEIAFDRRGHLYIAERDSHVIRKVEAKTGRLSTLAGTGVPGFSGDGGPAAKAHLRSPHSVVVLGDFMLVCDVGNHRIRSIDLATGTIDTFGGTGERAPTPNGALLRGTPLDGPRALAVGPGGMLYLALREGNAVYRIVRGAGTLLHIAGTGRQGHTGDGGPARQATLGGPKGLAVHGTLIYIADTENHAIRRIDLVSGVITTVLGTGVRGDGPEPDPLRCSLNRPHGVFATADGRLYVGDSEAHRIRVLTP